MQVDFRFSVGQKVVTPFGEIGIVKMASMDLEGKQYFIQMRASEQWIHEDFLTESTKEEKA